MRLCYFGDWRRPHFTLRHVATQLFAAFLQVTDFGAVVGGLSGAESCLYLAVAIFGAQALVILLSPAVTLSRQPDMVKDGCCA